MTMYGLNLKFAGLAIAAALTVTGGGVAAVTTPAHAAGIAAPAVVAATVRYDDLNLRSAAGIDRLNARIRAAADRLCIAPGVKGLDASLAGLECRDTLIEAAGSRVKAIVGGRDYAENGVVTLARGR